jgi:hypothetical protein
MVSTGNYFVIYTVGSGQPSGALDTAPPGACSCGLFFILQNLHIVAQHLTCMHIAWLSTACVIMPPCRLRTSTCRQ